MSELAHASFSLNELSNIKRNMTNDRPYADRFSFGFVVNLLQLKMKQNEDHLVLDEVDHLEGLRSHTQTRVEEQFRHPPLCPWWHKHFSAPRHIPRNIAERWGLTGNGNRDLLAMIKDVAKTYGDQIGVWQDVIAHRFVMDGHADRAARWLTGDWIIFAKHEGKNYYLGLATHKEAKDDPQGLYRRLRNMGEAEFPFVFV